MAIDTTIVPEEPNIADHTKLPLQIFMKGILDFSDFCSDLIELIEVDNLFCKAATDHLRIQTANPETYRLLIHYLKEKNAEYHTFN